MSDQNDASPSGDPITVHVVVAPLVMVRRDSDSAEGVFGFEQVRLFEGEVLPDWVAPDDIAHLRRKNLVRTIRGVLA